VVTEIVAGDVMAAVARIVMARKSMPVKRVSGKSVRAKSSAHMDRTVRCEAMEAMEAAKAMHAAAAKRRMEAATTPMEGAATPMEAAAASAAEPFRHCREICRKAERADRNAGRQNSYGSLDGGFHGRFSIVIVPATRNNMRAGTHLKLFTFQLFSPIAGF
jgi:hypothetical protein